MTFEFNNLGIFWLRINPAVF